MYLANPSRLRLLSVVGAAAAVALVAASPATAVAPERFQIDESYELDLSCDGVPAHIQATEQGSGTIRHIGPDGMAYFKFQWAGDVTWTNTETGKSVYLHADFIQRDQRIVDNGDGTITLRYRGKFNETDYNPDGSVAFRTQGVDTLVYVIDINGTPSDPDDDETLSEEYLGFTGHDGRDGVDFCAWFGEVTA